MTPPPVLRVAGAAKKYSRSLRRAMLYGAADVSRAALRLPRSEGLRPGEFWALEDVSFELRPGEVLGVLGLNGSGKSTLLRLISGIFMPDRGRVEVDGRVGALIEVGAGFHPLLTGRENIYVNGAVMGLSKREIDRKLDSIIEFADIGEFIDAPIKHYSSGMFVRLGFAVSIHCDPDILLVDEVLSVGDGAFRSRSIRAMTELMRRKAVVFVSHSLAQVQSLCTSVLVLQRGTARRYTDVHEGVSAYERLMWDAEAAANPGALARVSDILVNGCAGPEIALPYGAPATVTLEVEAAEPIRDVYATIIMQSVAQDMANAVVAITWDEMPSADLAPGRHRLELRVDGLPLLPGLYRVKANVGSGKLDKLHRRLQGPLLHVRRDSADGRPCRLNSGQGAVRLRGSWKLSAA